MKRTFHQAIKISVLSLAGLLAMGATHAASLDPLTAKNAVIKDTALPEKASPAIAPHRAMYLVKLGGTRNGSRVSDISGRMLFSWADDCHAWNVEQKMQLRFFYSEGEVSDTSSDLVSREAKDGSSFNFHTRRITEDSDGPETYTGYANLSVDKDGMGNGEATYAGDKDKHISLSSTLFPAHHTMQLLEHARKGEKFFSVNVFDGADENGFSEISSFISPALEAKSSIEKASAKDGGKDSAKDNPLLKVKAWPIRMAYFAPDSETGSPDYEMDMVLLDNGVIKSMTIDYGDYSMSAELVDVKPLSAPKCADSPSIPPS